MTDPDTEDEWSGRSTVPVDGHTVSGVDVDSQTRCAHYHTSRDVVALAFPCCDGFYPCYECHDAVTDHDRERWPRAAFDQPAILCGRCGTTLSIDEYLDCNDTCPACGCSFNPGCRKHYDRYFESREE